jgi:DNA polymerase
MIVEFWGGQWRKTPGVWEFTPEFYGLEGAAVSALLYPGQCFSYRSITYGHDTEDDVLYCLLPSGRKLAYHQPRLVRGTDPRKLDIWNITFMGWNSDSTKGAVGWRNMQTYGGRLCENVVQATSRDILASAMLRLEAAGYPIVLHVHDEVVCEVPKGFGSVEEFERLMMVREPWFADWPIRAAGGWRGHRYRK